MRPRIAIPLPHSTDLEYSERAMPQYEHAIALAGGEPVRILLTQELSQISSLMEQCHAVLLPGSNADVDPAKFAATPSPRTAAADIRRDAVDALLLEHAYQEDKPVLGICYGLQSLNVFCGGSLVQHIPDALPENLRGLVNHEAGKTVAIAHEVEIDQRSRLAEIIGELRNLPVNPHTIRRQTGSGKDYAWWPDAPKMALLKLLKGRTVIDSCSRCNGIRSVRCKWIERQTRSSNHL